MAAQAVECFLSQDYPHKRLIIADDADDPSFPAGIPGEPRYRSVYYAALKERFSIGKKRNIACEMAVGADLIAHFDSDDWSAPDRLSRQVAFIEQSGKALTGLNSMIFYDPSTQRAAVWTDRTGPNLSGTSMLYRREWWAQVRFKEQLPHAWGEDNHFRNAAMDAGEVHTVHDLGLMVSRVHDGNTNKKNMVGWRPFPVEQLPAGFPR